VEDIKPLRRVVALDCRGHGESDKPHDPEAYGNENMAGDVLNLMDYLGIEKADIFGYSMGSGITCYLLANHRERLTAAIMAAIGDRFVLEPADEVRSNDMAEAMLAEDPSQITDPVARNFRAIAEAIPGNDLEALAACAMRAREPVDAAALGAVDIPVLLLNGGKDEVMGTADELVAAIPRAMQVIIADADHLVVFDPLAREPALSFLQSQKEEA
jgi:pimeloyl-ACP methyl ester carboxylesterase